MDAGVALAQVANGFLKSPEFVAAYRADPGIGEFVNKLYNNVLHRAPESDGYAYWLAQLTAGTLSEAEVLVLFSESPEKPGQHYRRHSGRDRVTVDCRPIGIYCCWQTSTQCPAVISASCAGLIRMAQWMAPAAGSTSSKACSDRSR